MGVAADFVEQFLEPLDSFMTEGISSLASAIEGPLTVGATLYIVIFGILIVLGYVRAPISDFIVNVFKITILVALCTNVDTYTTYVKDFFFTDLPDGLSGVFSSGAGSGTAPSDVSSGAAFDDVMNQIILLGTQIYEQWSWDDWYPLLVGALVLLGLIPVAALLAIVILAKVGLTLLLVVGPIFIALYLFNATSSFTSSWLSGLVTFVALQVLAVIFIALLMSILSTLVEDANNLKGGEQIAAGLRMVGIYVVAMILALLLPQIAAQLAGSGIRAGGGLIHQGVNSTRTMANMARRGVGRGAMAGIRWGYNRASGRSGGSITQG